jgi:hypothetical protein
MKTLHINSVIEEALRGKMEEKRRRKGKKEEEREKKRKR